MNLNNIDIEGIIANCEVELNIQRNEDGFICKAPDNINIKELCKVVAEETKDDSKQVTAHVLLTIYDELDEYGYIETIN